MLQVHYHGLRLLSLCLLSASLAAQTATHKPATHKPAPTVVVASSGGYQLTEPMIVMALRYGRILAGADFSPSDAAALRSSLIAIFQREPAKQVQAYASVAKTLREASSGREPSWLDVAILRYEIWQWFGEKPDSFHDFESYPFGKMVLKYNPILINSGGMIVTKSDVDSLFYSNAFVAQAAGVAPPAQTEKDRFIEALPSRFGSLPRAQQEVLTRAELRLVDVHIMCDGTVKTRAAVMADIKRNVHSSADVPTVARQVETDSQFGAKYHHIYQSEMWAAVANATRVNGQIMGIGGLGRSASRSADINTGMSPGYNQFPH